MTDQLEVSVFACSSTVANHLRLELRGEKKYPFLINQRQIDDALAYHGSNEHPGF